MLKNTKDCNAPAQPPRFPRLGIQAQQLRRQLRRRACRPTRKDRSKNVLSSKVGKLLKTSWAESRGSGNKTNEAPTTAAGRYQRNRTTPDADIAATDTADRRDRWSINIPTVSHQTSTKAAIHSEDLTRDPTRARARRGEGDVP
jgi:hypothetical protein